MEIHTNLTHAGTDETLYHLRMKYWVPKGRRTVRKIITKCQNVRCRHPNLKAVALETPDLPNARIAPSTFQRVALDLAGPIAMKVCSKCRYGSGCNRYNLRKNGKGAF